jgi:hypothetical protein
VTNGPSGADEVLSTGGSPQDRYEQLRAWWSEHDCEDVLGLVRIPWGLRLLHFGVLGLLDEDVTGDGWFQAGAALPTAPGTRCTRVLLSAEDGATRASEAYRCILALIDRTCPSIETTKTKEGFA